ncbi:RadC family protein [uncultured Treponema sp.]|uniref:JAB domain-containing protein n=1 Tax=uncultured Treponema sp. TaxID=162155 RepID=UPI0025F6B5BB|nr:DNA repair protein RadC [uncultured Treponema sp.]
MNKTVKFPDLEKLSDENRIEIRELTIQHGLSFPSDEELIMLILGSGTKQTPIKELARQVLGIVMSSNSDNLVDNLMKINGMGKSKALMIAAALEFGKRINRNPQISLSSPADIIPYIQSYAMQKQEHFLCVTLNGAREIISIRVICTGSNNMAIIRPIEVFSEAIKEHASAIVISHNHPNGNPTPSDADIKTTLRIYQAAELLGITMLDHIIICRTGYFSFLEKGILEEEKLYDLL